MSEDAPSSDDLSDLVAEALRATPGVIEVRPSPRTLLRGLTRRTLRAGDRVVVDLRVDGDLATVNADLVVDPGESMVIVASAAQRNAATVLQGHIARSEVDVCVNPYFKSDLTSAGSAQTGQ